jgi:hypothetical protein
MPLLQELREDEDSVLQGMRSLPDLKLPFFLFSRPKQLTFS